MPEAAAPAVQPVEADAAACEPADEVLVEEELLVEEISIDGMCGVY
jgi:mycofactocin precursor